MAALAGYYISGEWLALAGFFLILGNSFPCFHGFRGGKGVANYLGYTLLIAPWAALLAAIIWVSVYWVKRIPFIASLFMTATLAVGHAASFHWELPTTLGAGAAFALIVFNHRNNFIDSWKNTETSGTK